MISDALVAYLHYLGIMGMFGALAIEHLEIGESITAKTARRLATVDAIYGLSAITVLATGVARLFISPKGVMFYMKNPVFHTKFTIFILIGILSIYPTVKILKARKLARTLNDTDSVELPKSIIHMVRLEILGVALLPLLAALMARGIGY